MNGRIERAFTLVELMVVVTIIVILVAILVPATEQAMYTAKLGRCATQLGGIAQVGRLYATDNQQYLPQWHGWDPIIIDEGMLNLTKPYADWKIYLDPLCGEIDLRPEATPQPNQKYINYQVLWGRGRFMFSPLVKMTDQIEFNGETSDMLASDRDSNDVSNGVYSESSHPDQISPPRMRFVVAQHDSTWWNPPHTLSRWQGNNRGPMDLNYAFKDGAVIRMNTVTHNDDRLLKLPDVPWISWTQRYMQIAP